MALNGPAHFILRTYTFFFVFVNDMFSAWNFVVVLLNKAGGLVRAMIEREEWRVIFFLRNRNTQSRISRIVW